MSEPEGRHFHGSDSSIAFSVSQIPSKTDEDRFVYQISHGEEKMAHIASFGVFDGHGGDYAAGKCSRDLHSRILHKYSDLSKNEVWSDTNPNDLIDRHFCTAARSCTEAIDVEVRKKSTSGTTAVSVFVIHNPDGSSRVFCPWVGDSTCVMFQLDGTGKSESYLMSQDHKPNIRREYDRIYGKTDLVWDDVPTEISAETFRDEKDPQHQRRKLAVPKSSGDHGLTGIDLTIHHEESFIKRRTSPEQPEIKGPIAVFGRYNVSLCMTRSIGDRHGPRSCIALPDVTAVTISNNHFARFVLASDGMWDVISIQEVTAIALSSRDPKRMSRRLALMAWHKRIVRAMRMDDITVVVVDVHPEYYMNPTVGCGCQVS